MKWRSVDELPKISGQYYCLCEFLAGGKGFADREFMLDRKEWEYQVFAWLDPEVPEHFLRSKKPCPWCKTYEWSIIKVDIDIDTGLGLFRFFCTGENSGCCFGPKRKTEQEAEAAIFERVK